MNKARPAEYQSGNGQAPASFLLVGAKWRPRTMAMPANSRVPMYSSGSISAESAKPMAASSAQDAHDQRRYGQPERAGGLG